MQMELQRQSWVIRVGPLSSQEPVNGKREAEEESQGET